jgi:hypothetical protein
MHKVAFRVRDLNKIIINRLWKDAGIFLNEHLKDSFLTYNNNLEPICKLKGNMTPG